MQYRSGYLRRLNDYDILSKKAEVQLEMHFIEAHRIVHSFAGAIKKSTIGFYTSEMVEGRSEQELYDAFTIFLGHMVLWNTRTNDECNQYLLLLRSVPNRIPRNEFEAIKASDAIIKRAENDRLYAITHRQQIKKAEIIEINATDILIQKYETYTKRVEQFDYGKYIQNCVKLVKDIKSSYEEENFEFFMDDYIQFVYSNTSFRVPRDEDYASFWSFDVMRKLLAQPNSLAPAARSVFAENKEYILCSK